MDRDGYWDDLTGDSERKSKTATDGDGNSGSRSESVSTASGNGSVSTEMANHRALYRALKMRGVAVGAGQDSSIASSKPSASPTP